MFFSVSSSFLARLAGERLVLVLVNKPLGNLKKRPVLVLHVSELIGRLVLVLVSVSVLCAALLRTGPYM